MSPDVAIVTTYPPPGRTHAGSSGVAAYSANLARALVGAGAETTVIAPEEDDAPPSCVDEGVVVERPFVRGGSAPLEGIRAALDLQPGVIHLQHETLLFGGVSSLVGLAAALRALRRAAAPAVVTLHQVVHPRILTRRFLQMHRLRVPVSAARAVLAVQQRLVVESADATIVHEPSFAAQIPPAVVIPHGLEEPVLADRATARRRLGLGNESRLVVLCFGFVAPYKGLEVALEAAAATPSVRLLVAGGPHPRVGGTYAHELRQRWGTAADFVGHVPEEDIASWHAAADVALLCYPAPHASSGAFAMALAHRTPVLVSEALAATVEAPPAMAVPADAGAVAARLQRLATQPGVLAELGRATRGLAAGRSWPEVARRHLELYASMWGERSPRTGGAHDQLDGS